jgi:CheY-like chemotaxis protein
MLATLIDQSAAEAVKAHLLVVEDEPTIRQLFAALLTSAGFSVAQAQDGFEALEQVRRKRPALILSDLNMPRMSGFELLSIVRRRFPSIHVIAMSGAFIGDSVPNGVAADAFYQKSGRHISTLVQVIETILGGGNVDPSAPGAKAPAAVGDEAVALWVTRRGAPIEGPYILLTCLECLRSFPHNVAEETTMSIQQTPCCFCNTTINYALLDPSVTHHPGYAPSETR